MFGASDGLVSNFALIAGVTGGNADSKAVLLAGLAGLAAGAFSMAAGEYISVRSQAEQALAEIDVERTRDRRATRGRSSASSPRCTSPRGSTRPGAVEVARQLSRDPDTALDVHVREELGLDPDDLPSATLAAGSSFLSFAIGAFLPVLPYLLGATGAAPGAAAHGGRAVPLRSVRHAAHAAALVVRRRAPGPRRRRRRRRDLRGRLPGRLGQLTPAPCGLRHTGSAARRVSESPQRRSPELSVSGNAGETYTLALAPQGQ